MNNSYLLLTVWEAGNLRSGLHDWVPSEGPRLGCRVLYYVLTWGKGWGNFLGSPHVRALHSWLNHLPVAPQPTTITLGIKFLTGILGGRKHSDHCKCDTSFLFFLLECSWFFMSLKLLYDWIRQCILGWNAIYIISVLSISIAPQWQCYVGHLITLLSCFSTR